MPEDSVLLDCQKRLNRLERIVEAHLAAEIERQTAIKEAFIRNNEDHGRLISDLRDIQKVQAELKDIASRNKVILAVVVGGAVFVAELLFRYIIPQL